MSPAEIAIIVSEAAARHGVSPEALMAVANLESSGNINAQNPRSSASGLFQFVDSTAREYGLTGNRRNDPVAQADAAAKMMATNARSLERTLGRPANAGELYLAHQQGLGGASALLRNPNRPAVDVLTDVYGSRQKAQNAIRLNGGSLNQSAGQFAGQWVNKANQRVALIPPGEIPNVVASRLDTTPQTRNVPRPQPRPDQRMVQGVGQVRLPELPPSSIGTTRNVPFPRLDPRVPNRMDLASLIPSNVMRQELQLQGQSYARQDNGLSAMQLAARVPVTPGDLVSRGPVPDPVDVGLRRALAMQQVPGPTSAPKDQTGLTANVYPTAPMGNSVATALAVTPRVTGFPTPVQQRPAVTGFPTPVTSRPTGLMTQPLRIVVQRDRRAFPMVGNTYTPNTASTSRVSSGFTG